MAKKNKDDEVTRLEKEIRELKSLNRSLMKRLKKVDKGYKEALEKEPEFDEAPFIPAKPKTCPECSQPVAIINIAGRKIEKCTHCTWRTKAVKV